ncbi:MAG TPA: 2-phosphosulfolactate phosphatase [Edaphocola sp.]|nr:2-phosphosulfolactate phosphatase [Edaphocola sp.]
MGAKPQLFTCLSPALIPLYDLSNTIVVVIDIFRATSTICAALDNGAKAVIPVATVEECLRLEKEQPRFMTAGERDGKVIEGLQGGNSPSEYLPEVISGKVLALTTTNGTRLLHLVKEADEIVIGSFLNLDVLCQYLVNSGKDILLACAGWRDKENLEDTLFAGAVIQRIDEYFQRSCDSSFIALSLYRQSQEAASLLDFMKSGSHYHRLSQFHLEQDMAYCCSINKHPVVPIFKDPFLVPQQAISLTEIENF